MTALSAELEGCKVKGEGEDGTEGTSTKLTSYSRSSLRDYFCQKTALPATALRTLTTTNGFLSSSPKKLGVDDAERFHPICLKSRARMNEAVGLHGELFATNFPS